MKTKIICLSLLAAAVGFLAGCVKTADGRSQVGMPLVKDTAEGRYERSVTEIFDTAKKVLANNGRLTAENRMNNSLEAKVNEYSVWVRVDPEDTAKPISKLTVQARSGAGMANRDLAIDIEKQIALALVR